jgi:hypothetical protein
MMLQVNPEQRADIYQVYYRLCQMRGVPYNLSIVPFTYVDA